MSDESRHSEAIPPAPQNQASSGHAGERLDRPARRDPREPGRRLPDNSPAPEIPELHPSADLEATREDEAQLDMPNPNAPYEPSSGAAPPLAEVEGEVAGPSGDTARPAGHPNDLNHLHDFEERETAEPTSQEAAETLSQHRDPLTGTPGAHPMGVGIGAVAGGAAAGFATGAVVASVAGPIGTALGGAVGAAIGAIAGGLAGKGIAESINPTAENDYWRDNYLSRPYVDEDASYDEYQAAYQYGWEARGRHPEQNWEAAEADLRARWEASEHRSLTWEKAKHAVHDAWERVSPKSARKNPPG